MDIIQNVRHLSQVSCVVYAFIFIFYLVKYQIVLDMIITKKNHYENTKMSFDSSFKIFFLKTF
jgi:hypothetical protein